MLNRYTDDDYVKILREIYPGRDVEIIASYDNGDGYSWDVVYVYRVYDVENYYVGSGSGCSCDYYEMYASYNDLSQFSSRRSVLSYLRNHSERKFRDVHSEVLANR